MLPDSILNKLTNGQKRYLKKIMRLTESRLEPKKVSRKLDHLRKSARKRLDEEELGVVLTAAAIADSSWAYWYENFDEWDAALGMVYADSIVVRDASGARMPAHTLNSRGKSNDQLCPAGFELESLTVYIYSDGSVTVDIVCVSHQGGGLTGFEDQNEGGGFWSTMYDIGKADVAGGVGGFAIGVATAIYTGGGSIPLATGTGAVGGSVYQGVIDAIEWAERH